MLLKKVPLNLGCGRFSLVLDEYFDSDVRNRRILDISIEDCDLILVIVSINYLNYV